LSSSTCTLSTPGTAQYGCTYGGTQSNGVCVLPAGQCLSARRLRG
jgi:hypothetical protein